MTGAQQGPDIDGLVFVEALDSGGYSDVYLYERRSPRMRVAVKVLKDARLSDAERAQFAAEAETMAELADHPYIVQVFTTGVLEDGRPYLVMKYYPPPNFARRAATDRLSVAEVLRTGIKVASAVETAHRAGIVHRDIKPANILVSQYGEPGLTDFGIAGHADVDDGDDLGVSIPWAPPEVLTGASNGSVQSDVYSLAATLWHLLAGRAPFEVPGGANTPSALMTRTLKLAPPSTGRADNPESLERLLAQSMSKNPQVRPRSVLEFGRALQAVEQEQRWARTDLVIEGIGGARAAKTDQFKPPGDDRTRTRTPTKPTAPAAKANERRAAAPATVARPARPTAAAPMPAFVEPKRPESEPAPDAEPRTTVRPISAAPMPAISPAEAPKIDRSVPPPDATVRRPTTVAESTSEPQRSRPGISRGWVIAVAAAVVVIAVVVGVVLSSGGSGDHRAGTDQTIAPTQVIAAPPQQPIVTAKYEKAKRAVVFTWTYQGAMAGDYFVVARTPDAPKRQLKSRRYVVPTSNPGKTCLVVAAYRGTTQIGSEFSRSACG